jgi:hypothetical protein
MIARRGHRARLPIRAPTRATLGLAVVAAAADARAQTVRVFVDIDPGVHVDVVEAGFSTPGPRRNTQTWHALIGCGPAPCRFVGPIGATFLRVVGSDGESTERVYFDHDARVVVHGAPRLHTVTALGGIGLAAALATIADLLVLGFARFPPTCSAFTDVHPGCEVQTALQWSLVGTAVVTTATLTPAFVMVATADRGRVSVMPWIAPRPAGDALIVGLRSRW